MLVLRCLAHLAVSFVAGFYITGWLHGFMPFLLAWAAGGGIAWLATIYGFLLLDVAIAIVAERIALRRAGIEG